MLFRSLASVANPAGQNQDPPVCDPGDLDVVSSFPDFLALSRSAHKSCYEHEDNRADRGNHDLSGSNARGPKKMARNGGSYHSDDDIFDHPVTRALHYLIGEPASDCADHEPD